MESLEMFEMEPVSELEDLVGILEGFFADQKVWLRLEMQEERGEEVVDFLLAQFAGTYDLCDIVQGEAGQDVALEFLLREVDEHTEEPRMITLPIDPQDIEVDLFEDKVVIDSTSFTLTIERLAEPVR